MNISVIIKHLHITIWGIHFILEGINSYITTSTRIKFIDMGCDNINN